jgi:hypothetical protein
MVAWFNQVLAGAHHGADDAEARQPVAVVAPSRRPDHPGRDKIADAVDALGIPGVTDARVGRLLWAHVDLKVHNASGERR